MSSVLPFHHDFAESGDIEGVRRALFDARHAYYEDPAGALAEASPSR